VNPVRGQRVLGYSDGMTKLQKLAAGYALLFFLVVAVGWVPAFKDASGALFGLFHLELKDDLLHGFSAVWAGFAAWRSWSASRFYFRTFGPIYFFDGVLGLLTGSGFLDLGIFQHGMLDLPFITRFFANLPHLIIGGLAIAIGAYFVSRIDAVREQAQVRSA
jgi:hypothetical protein